MQTITDVLEERGLVNLISDPNIPVMNLVGILQDELTGTAPDECVSC